MKKSKFTEAQIIFAFKLAETGHKVPGICRQLGFFRLLLNWNKKFGDHRVSELRRLRLVEDENF